MPLDEFLWSWRGFAFAVEGWREFGAPLIEE
jgi:hypothetical protein